MFQLPILSNCWQSRLEETFDFISQHLPLLNLKQPSKKETWRIKIPIKLCKMLCQFSLKDQRMAYGRKKPWDFAALHGCEGTLNKRWITEKRKCLCFSVKPWKYIMYITAWYIIFRWIIQRYILEQRCLSQHVFFFFYAFYCVLFCRTHLCLRMLFI